MARRVTRAQINAAADRYRIPRGIFYAMISAESGGRVDAVSSAGAIGPGQLMPSTAKGLGVNPRNPIQNLDGSARYLSQQFKTFGTWRSALAAYNAGPGNVRSGKWTGIPETVHYVKGILSEAAGGGAAMAPTPQPTLDTPAPATPDYSAVEGAAFQNLNDISAGRHPDPIKAISALAYAMPQQQQQPTASPLQPTVQIQGKATARDNKAVALVHEYLGTPYVWGGTKPGGFDCSGLLQYVWKQVGVNIPRVTYDQWKTGKTVAKNQLRPGDAVFFHMGKNGPEHVGMYIGGGKFVEAPHTGANVRISKLAGRKDYVGARRYG